MVSVAGTNLNIGEGKRTTEVGLAVVASREAVLAHGQLTLQSLVAVLQQVTHQPLVRIQAHCQRARRVLE